MAANKEIRILKTNTLEEFRQKSNDIALHLGDNEQLSTDLADKVLNYVDVSADANVFLTPRFEYKNGESVDNTAGYIILQDLASFTGFADGGTISQSGGYSATIIHATTEKILVKNSSGTFNAGQDLSDGTNTIANANVIRLVTEAYPKGLLRVYKNNVEIDQGLEADEFHVLNLAGKIALTGSPDVSDILEGTVLNQTGGFQGTVLRARSNELLFKAVSGSFNSGQVLKFTTIEEGGTVGGTAVATVNISGNLISYDTARGNAIELNTPAAANDDIKIFSANLVDALNELQGDIGSVESLTTTATTLQGAINEHDTELGTITAGAMGTAASTVSSAIAEHETQLGNIDFSGISSTVSGSLTTLHGEIGNPPSLTTTAKGNLVSAINEIDAVFDASNKSIDSGSAFTVNVTGDFTIDASDDIKLDADGGDIVLKDANSEYGRFTNSSGDLLIKTGSSLTTAITLDASDDGTAIFNHDIKLPDDGRVLLGADSDLILKQSGTQGTILNSTGHLIIQNSADDSDIVLQGDNGSGGLTDYIRVDGSNGKVKLSHYGTLVFQTKSDGVDITGELQSDSLDVDGLADISGNLNVGGNSTLTGNLTVNGTTVDINANADVSGTMAVGSTLGVTGVTTLADNLVLSGGNIDVTGTITASGEVQGGSLDINGVADISGNLTIGSLNTSSQHVRGSLNELHTELGDIAALNSTFTNDSNLVAALNELQTEVGANTYPAGGPASGLGNVTAAINAINSDIGTTSYSALSSTISGGLAQLHTEVGNLSLDTSATNLTSAINELHTEINTNATNIASNDGDISTINNNIGSLGSLTTSANSNLVAAINSVEDEVDALQTFQTTTNNNIGTIGSLATSSTSLVTAINELHGEINTNDTDIGNLQTGKLSLTDSGTQVLGTNLTFGTSGKTMTFASGTTLDLSAATLTLGGGGGTLNFNTAFVELDVDANQQGLKVKRETITGVSAGAPDAQLRWNEGNDKDVGWEVVYPNGADNAGLTTSLVTFDNAGDLVDGSTETGINVTFGSNNFNFVVQVDDSTIEVNGSNQLQVKDLGITSGKLASSAVTTGKIATSAVTNAKIANATITNAKLANSGVTVTDGTNSTVLDLGETLTIQGTNNEIEVVENANTFTVGLPNNVTIAGNLTVQGTTTTINTAELSIEDKTIQIGNNANTLADTNGAGIEFGNNAGKPTLLWDNTNTRLTVNKEFHSSVGFNGVGTNLTALNASNISSGTISDDRLPATITSNITGNVTGNVTGNADTATALATSRNFSITGDITAPTVGFTGTGPVVLNATIDNNTVDVAELNVTGTPGNGKAITYQSGGLQWSTISTTDTNTTYGVSVQAGAGNTSIIRLTGSDSTTDDVTLAAGSNITLTESGDTITIASTQATVNNPTITIGAGALIDVSADNNFTLNQSGAQTINVNVDLTELALETADVAGTDHLVYIDNGVQKKIAFSNVNLSAFDNDSGFVTSSGVTNVTVGTGLDVSGTATKNVTLDLSELTDMTGGMVGTDELVVLDSGVQKRKAVNEINLSLFNNDSSFTSNTGTVTSVSVGTGLDIGNASTTPNITLSLNELTDLTTAMANTDEFVILDSGSEKRKAANEINLSIFNNDSGFTSNVGDITRVNIAAGTGLTGSINTASGDHIQTIALDHLGIEDLTDPNADRIMFWDDSASSVKFLEAGSNLTITGTTINATDTNDDTITSIRQNNTGTYRTGNINLVNGNNIAITEGSAGTFNFAVTGITSDTGTPAILSNGTLNRTASSIRSDIGAGTMSSFTITDGVSTNEVIENSDSFNLLDSTYIDLRLSGSVGSRSIQASLNSNFGAFKNVAVTNSSNVIISTLTAENASDTLNIKEGSNITLSGDAGTDTFTISATNTTYSAGNGISLSGTTFSVAAGDGLTQTSSGLELSYDQRLPYSSGTHVKVGHSGTNGKSYLDFNVATAAGDSGYIDVYTSANGLSSELLNFKFEGDGDFHANGDVIAYSTTTASDVKLKDNIQKVEGALELVSQLDGVTFTWKKNGKASAGVIAQNVEKILPSAVKEVEALEGEEINKHVDYNQLSALFIEAIKELKEQNIELKAEVEKLKSINSNS